MQSSIALPKPSFVRQSVAARPSRRGSVRVQAAAWSKALTTKELSEKGNLAVVEVNGQKILFAQVDGDVFAVSNKCTHLNLPLVGKTAMFQGKVDNKCIVCPAHGTAFDLATGAVKGEWCPSFPNVPFVGKVTKEAPLPTFETRVNEAGTIEVLA